MFLLPPRGSGSGCVCLSCQILEPYTTQTVWKSVFTGFLAYPLRPHLLPLGGTLRALSCPGCKAAYSFIPGLCWSQKEVWSDTLLSWGVRKRLSQWPQSFEVIDPGLKSWFFFLREHYSDSEMHLQRRLHDMFTHRSKAFERLLSLILNVPMRYKLGENSEIIGCWCSNPDEAFVNPKLWNRFLLENKEARSQNIFKRKLKTPLFTLAVN